MKIPKKMKATPLKTERNVRQYRLDRYGVLRENNNGEWIVITEIAKKPKKKGVKKHG